MVKAYTDHTRRFYLEPQIGVLLIRYPDVRFAAKRPPDLQQIPDDMVPRVVEGFLSVAERSGGDKLAIWYIQESIMAGSDKNGLVISATLAVIGKFAFLEQAQKSLQEGGMFFGKPEAEGARALDKAAFDALPVQERCDIARPFLNDKEKANTPDGEGFAKVAWKIANRFQMPKPAKGEKAATKDKPAKETKPRDKGVKTLIRELFTSADGTKGKDGNDYPDGDHLHLSVTEIMSAVAGTKSSVTTAISDLRSDKYCGKDASGKVTTLNLVRVDDKYALEGSTAAVDAAKREAEATATAEKVKADKKAADKAAKDATSTQQPSATETAPVGA